MTLPTQDGYDWPTPHEASPERNQCDGCMQGAPLRDGLHVDKHDHAFMVCQRDKYGLPEDYWRAMKALGEET